MNCIRLLAIILITLLLMPWFMRWFFKYIDWVIFRMDKK